MSLIKSKSKKAIGKNIRTEIRAGKPKRQSIAIALETARRAGASIRKPKTQAQRAKTHKRIFGTSKLPKRKRRNL